MNGKSWEKVVKEKSNINQAGFIDSPIEIMVERLFDHFCNKANLLLKTLYDVWFIFGFIDSNFTNPILFLNFFYFFYFVLETKS